MRQRTAWLFIAALVVGSLAGPSAAAHRSPPTLTLTDVDPFTVHGTGFHRREHVRVTLRDITGTTTRRTTASRHGTFTVTFGAAKLGRCSGFSVSAVGGLGSHTSMRRRLPLPACNAAQAPDTPPPEREPSAGVRAS